MENVVWLKAPVRARFSSPDRDWYLGSDHTRVSTDQRVSWVQQQQQQQQQDWEQFLWGISARTRGMCRPGSALQRWAAGHHLQLLTGRSSNNFRD